MKRRMPDFGYVMLDTKRAGIVLFIQHPESGIQHL